VIYRAIIAKRKKFGAIVVQGVTPGSKIEKKFYNCLKMTYLGIILCKKSIARIPEA
jgi:hypothetical protein